MSRRTVVSLLPLAALLAALGVAAPAGAAARPQAEGAPGSEPVRWEPADKHGFGTSADRRSRVWFTLRATEMSEVYYPDLSHPSARSLEWVVARGDRAERALTAATGTVARTAGSLSYRQTFTDRRGRWVLTVDYVTDPQRATVLAHVRLTSRDGRAYRVSALYDPTLYNTGADDRGRTVGATLVARDRHVASALSAVPAFRRTTSTYAGASDAWHDLLLHGELTRESDARRAGNVRQAGTLSITGLAGNQEATVALGFGRSAGTARRAARATLARGVAAVTADYDGGWRAYRGRLLSVPAAVLAASPAAVAAYESSVLVLHASEDKANPGAFVASPSMPWGWGRLTIDPGNPRSGPYHLVWPRDLYEIAEAELAAGDRAAAVRALDFMLFRQQEANGSIPQNTQVDGRPKWTGLQLDEVALPIVLAAELGRSDARTWTRVRRAADFVLAKGPKTGQERWENQDGYSPASIASQIAGLVSAAGIARANGDATRAASYERTADAWAGNVQRWTATTNGPLGAGPYYLRVTKDRNPNRGTTYKLGDSGPSKIDQRTVLDPSFLELVRLGVKRPDDAAVLATLALVDRDLAVPTPAGTLFHRFSRDGYGETRTGGGWALNPDDTFRTLGRAWPLLAGERGEYEIMAGRSGVPALTAMAGTANDGGMLPEQAWDGRPPTGRDGFTAGEGTFSATPLAWSHAELIRLAWSIQEGRSVGTPKAVACRYTGAC